ncbi:unnamed protein product [Prorocentrum cordatum]|uniref:Integrase catalytic domain-containing protein n=1 Tax=Prorocentrum cordatum TaxID=2364126 RepID=A0ABN9P8R6_9DINO|nr:unnamed protein product [Polarella glacialis]
MRKAELQAELCQWDENCRHMTVEMLRARLRQIHKAMPLEVRPTSMHKKKAELVKDAEDAGCILTGRETKGDLQILIVERCKELGVQVSPSEIIPFGRHRGQTYIHLFEKEREYAGWLVSMRDPRFKKLTDWLISKGVKAEDMMNKEKFELPQPEVKYEKSESQWFMVKDVKDESAQRIPNRPTMKRSCHEEQVKMEDVKTKEDQIIDLLGDMKNQMHALTSRVQKATWLAGHLDKSVTPAWSLLTDTAKVKLMEVLQSRKKSKRLIRNCLALVMDQVADQGHVHWEWPKDLSPYRWPELRQVFRDAEMQATVCDGCMLGVKAIDTGLPMQKPWEIWSTSSVLRQRLAVRCDGRHSHSPCVGGARTAATAYYPDEFVRRAVRAMLHEPGYLEIKRHIEEQEGENDLELGYAVSKSEAEIDADTLRKVEISARRIHAACGHCPFVQVAKSLAAKGADKRIVDHVRQMRCSACDESQKHCPPRPVGSADEVPKKWAVLQSDLAEWEDPCTHEKFKIALYLDMGSRLGVGHTLFKMVKSRNATAEDLKDSIWSRWIGYFGRPRVLQVDPEGAWMSNAIRENLEGSGIQMDPIPGQAHWQIGGVERLISLIKDTMTVLAKEHPGRSCEEYLARAMAAYNEFDRHRGFSPLQVALGRAPDLDGAFVDVPGDPINLPALESEAVDTEFGNNFQLMRKAQEELLRWIYGERARRAAHARSRRLRVYTPGTLVYYFRNPKSSSMTGRFYGPARVLASETVHRHGEAQARPRVWLNACGRLIRCDPCQLRDASDREIAEHDILHGTELPWTFNQLTSNLRPGQFEDLAEDERLPASSSAVGDYGKDKSARQLAKDEKEQSALLVESESESCFWAKEDSAVEIEITLPEGAKACTAVRDFGAFVATQLRRQRAEVRERSLSADDLEKFKKAKSKEAQEWIKELVLEALPDHVRVPADRLMRLRWVLTWKIYPSEPGGRKAKARLVILGYQDPDLTTEESYAPTATRTARQVFLQKAAHLRMRVAKGDVKSAFLQGEELDRDLFVRPTGDIAEFLGLRPGQVAILKKSAYGLVQAPRAWHQAVNKKLQELGWRQLESDPCVWILTRFISEGQPEYIIGMALSHVDDFLFAGRDGDDVWAHAKKSIMDAFRWTEWEYGKFTQCGVDIHQREDYSFRLDQKTYLEQIVEIEVPPDRRRQPSSPVTSSEKSQFRAATGSLQWKGTQTGPDILAELSLLQSKTESCTVEDLLKINKLIKRAKEGNNRFLEVFSFPEKESLAVIGGKVKGYLL